MRREIRNKRAGEVLKLLDFLLPLLRLELSVVKFAVEKYESEYLEGGQSLESYTLSASEALSFFPSCQVAVEPLVVALADDVPYVGLNVRLLDVLTILTMIARGAMKEKAKLIFDWFNSSHSGIMSEVELNLFLLRIGNCFLKMKLIGRIEFSKEDARHMAFVARVSDGYKFLLPGLTFNDFYRWLSENRLAEAIFTFVRVLCRLIDTVYSLENKANALHSILQQMEDYKKSSPPIPHYNWFGNTCQESKYSINIIYRSQHEVSVCIHYPNNTAKEVYIECKKTCSVPHPLYRLSKRFATLKPSDICCSKNYYLTSYQKSILKKMSYSHGATSFRVDIKNLDADSDYLFTLYTEVLKYPPVKVHTIPSTQQLSDHHKVRILCIIQH